MNSKCPFLKDYHVFEFYLQKLISKHTNGENYVNYMNLFSKVEPIIRLSP